MLTVCACYIVGVWVYGCIYDWELRWVGYLHAGRLGVYVICWFCVVYD